MTTKHGTHLEATFGGEALEGLYDTRSAVLGLDLEEQDDEALTDDVTDVPSDGPPEEPGKPVAEDETLRAQMRGRAVPVPPAPVELVHSFVVDQYSPVYGQRLVGEFTSRILTTGLELKYGATKSQLLAACNAQTVDRDIQDLAEQAARLFVAITSAPPWFNPLTFEDQFYIAAVHREVASHEARFWQQMDSPPATPPKSARKLPTKR